MHFVSKIFIFTENHLNRKDPEDKKLLFFYPNNLDVSEKLNSVSLVQALMAFCQGFNSEFDSLLGKMGKYVFLECEKGYFLVIQMMFSKEEEIGTENDEIKTTKAQSLDVRDAASSHEVNFSVLKEILVRMYETFELFFGSLESYVVDGDLNPLRRRLESFCKMYFQLGKNKSSLQNFNIFDILDGINFLPVPTPMFLRIQSFLNYTENEFSKYLVPSCMFNYEQYVLFSGLNHHQARLINRFGPVLIEEYVGKSSDSQNNSEIAFLTGPSFSKDKKASAPQLYLCAEEPCYLIAFRHRSVILYFFLKKEYLDDLSFYKDLQTYLAPKLAKLEDLISGKMNVIYQFDETYKYLYFNHMNLAIKSSLIRQHTTNLPESLRTISVMHDLFQLQKSDQLREIYLKVKNDTWFVGKYYGGREFFLIFDNKTCSLTEVHQQVHKISAIFFASPTSSIEVDG